MEQQSPALPLMLLIKQRKTKPPGLIWSLVHIRILGGCLKAMEHTNASLRSVVYLSAALKYKQLIEFWCFRHAIRISWQSKTCLTFGDMQLQIFLLDIQRKTISGSCEIPFLPSSAVKKLINGFTTSVGRIDDVVIHSSGEKTVPAPIEDVVMGSN